ncbi:MAG: Outer rane efflux family protein, partial [Myxococcales bacterium]|nr:Outer rane efflux family protein [Myxococcales bacterium]
AATGQSSATTYNFFASGITVTQLLYDFGQTSQRWRAQRASAEATALLETSIERQLDLNVRATFFGARANQALVAVAEQTVANLRRHLDQTQAFVGAGSRPDIDLYQSRADLAAAEVQLINARNNYSQSRAQLNQAMGVEGPIDFEVADESLGPTTGEDAPADALVAEALEGRPEVASLARERRAQELTLAAVRGQYGPSVAAVAGVAEGGEAWERQGWNAQAGVSLTWSLYQGGATRATVREAEARLRALGAQVDALRQQIRLQIEQIRLAISAARASKVGAGEAQANARMRLALAEGRYQAGVGNIIELSDAQVALTSASTQVVSAEFQLATARAQLIQALGREGS